MMEPEFIVKDSGQRQQFETGAVRDIQDSKPRFDLISPLAQKRLAELLRKGAVKYTEWNWALGIPNSRCFASLCRHLHDWSIGNTDEDHAAAVMFNIMVIIHNEEAVKMNILSKELLDMPPAYIKNIVKSPKGE